MIKISYVYLDILGAILHTFLTLAQYGYDVILSKVCNLLSSLLLSAILIISSVYTLCASLLNLCGDFNMLSLFSKNFFSHETLLYYIFFSISFFIIITIIQQ